MRIDPETGFIIPERPSFINQVCLLYPVYRKYFGPWKALKTAWRIAGK